MLLSKPNYSTEKAYNVISDPDAHVHSLTPTHFYLHTTLSLSLSLSRSLLHEPTFSHFLLPCFLKSSSLSLVHISQLSAHPNPLHISHSLTVKRIFHFTLATAVIFTHVTRSNKNYANSKISRIQLSRYHKCHSM